MPGQIGISEASFGALGEGTSKRIVAVVGTSAYTIAPAAGHWRYLRVTNTHATAVVSVGINESPEAAPADNPGVAGNWKVGYDLPAGATELIPLTGAVTDIRLLSNAVSTTVVLNLIA